MLVQVIQFAAITTGCLLGIGCVLAVAAVIAYSRFRSRMKAQDHLVWP